MSLSSSIIIILLFLVDNEHTSHFIIQYTILELKTIINNFLSINKNKLTTTTTIYL
jgi:hypothetical protein